MSDIPVWVDWFGQLSTKIFKAKEDGLIERVKRVDWGKGDPAILRYGDENIDPFSFLYSLAQTLGERNNKVAVKESVSLLFRIDNQDIFSESEQSKSFPSPSSATPALFHDGKRFNPKLLWKLFRQAHQGIDAIDAIDFAAALKIKQVKTGKLTQCLFLIKPSDFMPIDEGILQKHEEFSLPSNKEAKKKIEGGDQGLDYYKSLLKKFQSAFPGRSFYEINAELIDERKNRTAKQKEQKKQKKTSKGDKSMTHPLNQILYGPPGTGKTWNTVNHALAIIEDKDVKALEEEGRDSVKQRFDALKDEGQIEMVTFHQNFAYEDFIEGIRPVLDDDSDDSINVHYEIVDGIFKTIADRAKTNLVQPGQDKKAINISALLGVLAEHIEERLENGEKLTFHPGRVDYEITHINRKQNGEFRSISALNTNTQITTNFARQVIERDYVNFLKSEIKSHDDIAPRYKHTLEKHPLARLYFGLYKWLKKIQDPLNPEELQGDTTSLESLKYVLIIDEINRGNIAKIFGELITLIEQSKRIGESDATTATLPYSSNSMEGGFGVPNNLYIIGTMNTADRSIAPLDTALRRRFDFIEMMPEPEHPLISQNLDGVNCQQLLSMMNERITALIDREHQIGHSYFIDINSMAQLADAFKNRIIPLLEEYFYDDREKINLVLDNNKFMISKKIRIGLFYNTEFVNTEKMIYELIKPNNPEWEKPENYQAIYQSKLQAEETEAADAT